MTEQVPQGQALNEQLLTDQFLTEQERTRLPFNDKDLQDYKIQRLIGRGGMANVYLAEDIRLERPVAIKIMTLSQQQLSNHEQVKEARLLARLNHPNIVQIHQLLSKDNHIGLVMEYLKQGTLQQYLANQVASLNQKLQWLSQISAGLAAAHEVGIIHCDLKLGNILLSDDLTAKIADFGISRQTNTPQTVGPEYGSLSTMSPEQLQHQPIDHHSDLFSLGVLAYQLIVGQHPFGRGSATQLAQRIVNESPTDANLIHGDMPPPLGELINQLLARLPQHRPDSTAAVAGQFRQILIDVTQHETLNQDTVILDSDAFLPAPKSKSTKKKWLLSMLLLAGVLSAVVFFTTGFTPATVRYVAVLRPVFSTTGTIDPSQKDMVIDTIDDAIRQRIISTGNMQLISRREVAAIKGGVKLIGKATGATDIITTELDCNKTRCNVSFSRLNGANQTVHKRQYWRTVFESFTDIYQSSQANFAALFPDYGVDGLTQHLVSEADYRAYIHLFNQITYQGQVNDQTLRQLNQLLTRSPYLFAAYRLLLSTAIDFYAQTSDPGPLNQLKQRMQAAPPEYRYSATQAVDTFWLSTALGELAEAKKQLDVAIKRRVEPSTLAAMQAHWFEGKGLFSQAILGYQQALKMRRSTALQYNLALSYSRNSDYSPAIKILLSLLTILPQHYKANQLLATLKMYQGDISSAISRYEKIIATNTQNAQSLDLSNLGVAYALAGQYQKALALAIRAVDASPEHPAFVLNLADAHQSLGHQQQAQHHYNQVIVLTQDKQDIRSRLFRAQALVHISALQAAVKVLNQLKQQAPKHAEVAFTAALVYAQLNENISAVNQVEEALSGGIGVIWFNLPFFDGLCANQQFVRLITERGHSHRCPE